MAFKRPSKGFQGLQKAFERPSKGLQKAFRKSLKNL
jgi:hypothetical protein